MLLKLLQAAGAVLLLVATPLCAQLQVLTYRPANAVYSALLDRIIMVNGNPSQLHIYDPISKADTVIGLPSAPTTLAISSDGKHAVVGHSGSISHIDLSKPQPAIERTTNVNFSVQHIAVTKTGYAYLTPLSFGYIRYVNLSTGTLTTTNEFAAENESFYLRGDESLLRIGYRKYSLVAGVIQTPSTWELGNCESSESKMPLDGNRFVCKSGAVFDDSTASYVGSIGDAWVTALGVSTSRNEIAVIYESPHASIDIRAQVSLLGSQYLQERGRFSLPRFSAGPNTFPGVGRFAFYNNAGTHLSVVAQADVASGLLNDYGIATYALSVPCSVSLSVGSAVLAAGGGTGEFTVAGASSCVWQAITSVPWITITTNVNAAGTTALHYYVAQNTTGIARTGSITIGAASHQVTQSATSTSPSVMTLPYSVVDAGYSDALDRLILVGRRPNQLHIYNAVTKQETSAVPLELAPNSLALSSDGKFALIGHDGWITRVNLATSSVTNTWRVPMVVSDVALTATHAYALPASYAAASIVSVPIASGVPAFAATNVGWSQRAALSAGGKYLFVTGSYGGPQRWDLSGGLPVYLRQGQQSPDCGRLWPSADGARLFTRCGTVLRLSDVPAQDFAGNGFLSEAPEIRAVVHIPSRGLVYAIPQDHLYETDSLVHRYTYEFLRLESKFPLPSFQAAAQTLAGHGRHIFATSDSNTLVIVMEGTTASSPEKQYSAVYTVAIDSAPTCTYSVNPSALSFTSAGGGSLVTVTTQSGCPWTPVPSDDWIDVNTRDRFGSGSFNAFAFSTDAGITRTGSIVIGSQTVPVMQSGTCGYTLTPLSAIVPAAGGTGALTIAHTGACGNWTATSSKSWLQVYPLTSNASSASYTVFPNFSSAARTAEVTIGGRTFTVSQYGSAGTANERFVGQMYFNFFGRLPSATEAAFHVGTLNKGMSRTDLVMNFFNSGEFNSGGRFIAGLYVGLLDRNAEYSGWLFQRNALATGVVNQLQLSGNFVTSAEWSLKFGSPGNADFVRLLYRYILLREASQAEVDLQVNAIIGGIVTRTTLANAFLNSNEFRNGTGPRLTAFLLYSTLVLRDPSPSELTSRIAQLQSGTGVRTLVEEILGTPEFAGLFN